MGLIGLPRWLVIKNPLATAGDAGDQVRSLGQEDPLELEMTTYSSIIAQKISWTEEPGGLQSMESQRVNMTECTHTYNTCIYVYGIYYMALH